jgi:hypothetical protein
MDVFETDSSDNRTKVALKPAGSSVALLPNQYMTAQEFREAMTMQLCFYGNAYALVERNSVGDVISLIPLMSANMDVRLEGKRLFIAISVTMNTPTSRSGKYFTLKGLVLMAWWGCLRLPMRANLRVLRSQWRISSVSFTLTARSLRSF